MKTNLFRLLFLLSTFSFCQESEIFIKSKIPIIKTIYNKHTDVIFFNNFNENEIHVNSFNNSYSTILNGLGSAVIDYDVSVNGKYAATANQDKSIIIWEVKPKKMLLKFNPNQGTLKRISFFNDSIFFSLGEKGMLKKWSIKGRLLYELNISEFALNAISSFDNKIIIGGYDRYLRVVDDKLKKIQKIQKIGEIISCILINQEQNIIYVGDIKGNLHVLDFKLKLIKSISPHKSVITDMHLINSKYLATSSWDKTIKIISIEDYIIQKTFIGHKDYIFSFTIRGKELYSSSRDKKIMKWNLEKYIE